MTPLLTNVQQPIGASGITLLGNESWSADEYNVDLATPQLAVKTFDRMVRSDAHVRASLNSLLHALMSAQWRIDAAKEDPQGEEIAKFVRSVLMPGETYGYSGLTPWSQTLRNVLKGTVHGFAVLEKVWGYRPRDGKQVYAALEARKAKTIRNWELTTSGPSRLEAVVQFAQKRDGSFDDIRIPADRVIVYTFNREGDDFWGESILRPAHNHWRVKKDMILFDAIQKERLGGIFYLQAREGATVTDEQIKQGKAMLEAFRLHQKQGLYVPSAFELKSIFPQGEGGKFIESIEYHDGEIELSMGAMYQSLGTGDKGALSVGTLQADMMLLSYQGHAKSIEDVFGEQAIVDLVDTNFGEREFYPRLACENFLQMKPDRQAQLLEPLVRAGLVRIDKKLRIYFRERMSLPPEDPATLEPVPGQALLGAGATDPNDPSGGKPEPKPETKQAIRKAAGSGYWLRREPLPHEAHADWHGMQQYLEEQPKRIWYREVSTIRDRQIKSLAALAAKATEGELAQGQIGKPELGTLAAALKVGLLDAYRHGRATVLSEAKSARMQKAESLDDEFSPDPTKAQARWIERLAQGLALGMTLKLVGEAVKAGQQAQDQELPASEIEMAVREALGDLSVPLVQADVAGVVAQAFTTGRVEQMQSMKSQIQAIYYSAVMDDGTCGPCSAMDGAELDPETFQSAVPNPNCDYPPRCRCTAIAVWRAREQREAA